KVAALTQSERRPRREDASKSCYQRRDRGHNTPEGHAGRHHSLPLDPIRQEPQGQYAQGVDKKERGSQQTILRVGDSELGLNVIANGQERVAVGIVHEVCQPQQPEDIGRVATAHPVLLRSGYTPVPEGPIMYISLFLLQRRSP